jgi:hypothetical protein
MDHIYRDKKVVGVFVRFRAPFILVSYLFSLFCIRLKNGAAGYILADLDVSEFWHLEMERMVF